MSYQSGYYNEYHEGLVELSKGFLDILLNQMVNTTMVAAVKGRRKCFPHDSGQNYFSCLSVQHMRTLVSFHGSDENIDIVLLRLITYRNV